MSMPIMYMYMKIVLIRSVLKFTLLWFYNLSKQCLLFDIICVSRQIEFLSEQDISVPHADRKLVGT